MLDSLISSASEGKCLHFLLADLLFPSPIEDEACTPSTVQ